MLGLNFESSVSRDISIQLWWKWYRSKAESLRKPISKELAPEDASISRYERFESEYQIQDSMNILFFDAKIHKNTPYFFVSKIIVEI